MANEIITGVRNSHVSMKDQCIYVQTQFRMMHYSHQNIRKEGIV